MPIRTEAPQRKILWQWLHCVWGSWAVKMHAQMHANLALGLLETVGYDSKSTQA